MGRGNGITGAAALTEGFRRAGLGGGTSTPGALAPQYRRMPVNRVENGRNTWWLDGRLHRGDGPAIEHADGGEEWWFEGKRHRVVGPALTTTDGTREWWLGGLRHREGGPAVERADGGEEWWAHGKMHREYGAPTTGKSRKM